MTWCLVFFFFFFFSVEKDELASRAYLSELQSIKSHLEDAESRLMRGMQTPHPSTITGDVADNAVHIAEQEVRRSDQHNYSLYWSISGQSVLQF